LTLDIKRKRQEKISEFLHPTIISTVGVNAVGLTIFLEEQESALQE